ncbi:Ig-like domain-containing protein [Yinghuangia aomiensis]
MRRALPDPPRPGRRARQPDPRGSPGPRGFRRAGRARQRSERPFRGTSVDHAQARGGEGAAAAPGTSARPTTLPPGPPRSSGPGPLGPASPPATPPTSKPATTPATTTPPTARPPSTPPPTHTAAPLAADDAATVRAGGAVTLDVLANDRGDRLRMTGAPVAFGRYGLITCDKRSGACTYRTYDGFRTGTDVFSYTVKDAGGRTDSAIVRITVTAR